MPKISVIYHHFPHYRAPVMRAMARSTRNAYTFFGGLDDYQGIKAFRGDDVVKIEPITFLHDDEKGKVDITGWERAVSNEFDATIILGNMNMVGAWRAMGKAKRNGLATAYWAHGWLKKEKWPKAKIRNFFFGRADRVLTYGSRAVAIAGATGFPTEKIRVIWNSLDYDLQSTHYNRNVDVPRDQLRAEIGMPVGVPLIMTISRVTEICHYDWLIAAVAKLRASGTPAEIWMVGEGPMLAALKQQADTLNVPLHAQGALYDESVIARQIMAADLIASPGKVGLTAMHALAYGTPTVTHSDFDRQMPEVEAILEGISGRFFRFGDIDGLATAISDVLADETDYRERRIRVRSALEGRFTPSDQARLIDDAMDEIIHAAKKRQ